MEQLRNGNVYDCFNWVEHLNFSCYGVECVGVQAKCGKVQQQSAEVQRLGILLNKTREEVARDNVTQAEIDKISDHIDQRFNKLEEKIDRLIQQRA